MDYTPEQLREWANNRELAATNYPLDSNGNSRAILGANVLRAHAEKIEECERYRKAMLKADEDSFTSSCGFCRNTHETLRAALKETK